MNRTLSMAELKRRALEEQDALDAKIVAGAPASLSPHPTMASGAADSTEQQLKMLEQMAAEGKLNPFGKATQVDVVQQLRALNAAAAAASGGDAKAGGASAASAADAQATKEDAYVAQRHKDEADTLTKMMKVIHPNPVKMFACGAEVALMLLETGELYIWCDDDPHPKLMNGYMSASAASTAAAIAAAGGGGLAEALSSEAGAMLDDHRVYWTEHELRVMAAGDDGQEKLHALAVRMGVPFFSREEILTRIREKTQKDPGLVAEHVRGDPSALASAQLERIAGALGVLAPPSRERLVRAIMKHRLQSTVFVKHIAAGSHHFAAITFEPSDNLWTWGLNDKGQLGLGDTEPRGFPTKVTTLPEAVAQIQCGDKFTMCVVEGGDMYSWGQGEHGQLGHTSARGTVDASAPMPVVAENVLSPKRMAVLSHKAAALRAGSAASSGGAGGGGGGGGGGIGTGAGAQAAGPSSSGGAAQAGAAGASGGAAGTAGTNAGGAAGGGRRQSGAGAGHGGRAGAHEGAGGGEAGGMRYREGDEEVTELLRGSQSRGTRVLRLAAGGNQACAWTSKYEPQPGVSLEDHENLEHWQQEAFEKFYRLKALREMHDELHRAHGFPDACPAHAEMVLCEPSKQEQAHENARREQMRLQKTNYFPEICTVEGPNHIVARNCSKCFGRGYTRDRYLTQLDVFIEGKSRELEQKKAVIQRSQAGIRSLMQSILEQGRDADNVRAEARRLANELDELSREEQAEGLRRSKQGGGAGSASVAESLLKRVREKREQTKARQDNCAHREMLCRKQLESLQSQVHSARVQLLADHTDYNNTDTELMLFRRVRIRRQKRLAWNMIAQREAYTRKVIVAAHELWTKVEEAEFSRLMNDKDTVKRLKDNYGVHQDEPQVYELVLELSTRKLKALAKEAIKRMQRFKLSSRRFEGHVVLGDCVRGWMEKDSKGRPRLRVIGPGGHEYCHFFQQSEGECSLPCPYRCVHEKMPERLRQQALRQQGFKGHDLAPVKPGISTFLLDKPLLYCGFHRYSKSQTHYVRKLRVYLDGGGTGDGMQQIYGVIYNNKPGALMPTTMLPGAVSAPVDIERGRHAGWVDLPFATPVALPRRSEDDAASGASDETRGLWLGLFAAHGGSVVRLFGNRCDPDNTNLTAGDSFHAAEVPGEFPNPTVVPFRASLYAETSGLWSRLLAIVLDSCRLRMRTNRLALTLLLERQNRKLRKRAAAKAVAETR